MDLKSFIITPDLFIDPITKDTMRESGIEDIYKQLFYRCSNYDITVLKLDWSDGYISIKNEYGKEIVCGFQECKRKLANQDNSFLSRFTQNLVYFYELEKADPERMKIAKIAFLPSEKWADLVFVEGIFKTDFWKLFKAFYDEHRMIKGNSASNFYKNSANVRDLMGTYSSQFNKLRLKWKIQDELDFKEILQEIIDNCL